MRLKAIIGLGNPGSQYETTRHNAGFMVADNLAEAFRGSWHRWRSDGLVARAEIGGVPVVLGKPQTWMNASGRFVAALSGFHKLEPSDLLVVHDELDLPLGRLRLARGGGTAGHKGLDSIVAETGNPTFSRLRIGVGKQPDDRDTIAWVLSPFSDAELRVLSAVVDEAVRAAETWARDGMDAAMNRHNGFAVEIEEKA